MTECDNLIFTQVNNSCNITPSVYNNKTEFDVDSLKLLMDVYKHFAYTFCSLALILNILNIIAIAKAPSKLTPHSKLVISLAISDGCIVLPIILTLSTYTLHKQLCIHAALLLYFVPGVTLASMLNLLALGIDHYIAIVKPLHYNRIVSNSRTNVFIVLIWIAAFSISVTETIPAVVKYKKNNGILEPFCQYMLFNYTPRITSFIIILELIGLIILYTRVYAAYKKYVTRHQTFRPDHQHNNKAIVTTLLVIGTYMICFVPISLLHIVAYFFPDVHLFILTRYGGFIHLISEALVLSNSLFDALLYALRLGVVKDGYGVIFRNIGKTCRICFQNKEQTNSSVTSITTEFIQNEAAC